jgi:succinate-semialdehyde dehydrogenase/glutarate-semialdehyde dehydrogenase
MNNFDEFQRALGPIPLGPVVGGNPLDGDGVIPARSTPREDVPPITDSTPFPG